MLAVGTWSVRKQSPLSPDFHRCDCGQLMFDARGSITWHGKRLFKMSKRPAGGECDKRRGGTAVAIRSGAPAANGPLGGWAESWRNRFWPLSSGIAFKEQCCQSEAAVLGRSEVLGTDCGKTKAPQPPPARSSVRATPPACLASAHPSLSTLVQCPGHTFALDCNAQRAKLSPRALSRSFHSLASQYPPPTTFALLHTRPGLHHTALHRTSVCNPWNTR
ncbi:hypothetical protein B0T22DRAFT_287525 [Podospora appendiculata]|uniref:Uncharacterized protein n=1 Tax=Podospora appendiculata TaxID=314037 RepID=A0AAE0X1J6_9PEZI|nr:hypothetical protein B0T22DRAFT_287525 [Podospora appendiculata]